METCSVPNCKLKSETKFHSPRNELQLNLWRKILKIDDTKFFICDQHFEDQFVRTKRLGVTVNAYPSLYLSNVEPGSSDFCQCCMRSFVSKFFNQTDEVFVISEGFQEIFSDVIGCEIPPGVICSKCHDSISNFVKFRDNVRKNQEIRNIFLSNDSKNYLEETEEEEFQVEVESDQIESSECDEEPQFEVLQYEDEEYIVEMQDNDEYCETEVGNDLDIEIKQEYIEDENKEQQEVERSEIKTNMRHRINSNRETNLIHSMGIHKLNLEANDEHFENSSTIIKVEPIEDRECTDFEQQILSNVLKDEVNSNLEDQTKHLPKISYPRTLPSHLYQNLLKRKTFSPVIPNSSPTSSKFQKLSSRVPSKASNYVATIPRQPKLGLKGLKCQYCPARFDDCDLIYEHIQEKHKFQCPSCNQSFPFKIKLIQHQVSDHKGSSKEQSLKSQMALSFSCTYCLMRFSMSENLETHMKDKHNVNLTGLGSYDDDEEKSASLSHRILNSFKRARPGSSGVVNIKKES